MTIQRRLGNAPILMLLGGFLAYGSASGQECSNSDIAGRYASLGRISILAPGAQQNNWAAGTFFADGEGRITEWKDTFVVVPPGATEPLVQERDIVAAAALVGRLPAYEVTGDCRITVTLPTPEFDVILVGGVANGGKEVFTTQTSPSTALAGGIFKAVTPSSPPILEEIGRLTGRIARRLGLVP